MSVRRTLCITAAACASLLIASEVGAYAATGQPLLLGKINNANATTSVVSSSGPALRLDPGPGAAPAGRLPWAGGEPPRRPA